MLGAAGDRAFTDEMGEERHFMALCGLTSISAKIASNAVDSVCEPIGIVDDSVGCAGIGRDEVTSSLKRTSTTSRW